MIVNGDSLEVLKTLEDNSIDTVITDPPYGYSFMGKDWDKAVPSVEIWQECLRVLKPGGWCMVMSAPRSDVQNAMISRLMEAGFRLDFTPIYWTYASGFPKAGNVGKLVDKRLGAEREVVEEYDRRSKIDGIKRQPHVNRPEQFDVGKSTITQVTVPATPQAKALDGSYTGFQPKPAVEVVIVAMKPLSEKTYVDQALKNGKGITWLDDCRVPTENGQPITVNRHEGYDSNSLNGSTAGKWQGKQEVVTTGRFPANLLVSDDVLNDGTITKSPKTYTRKADGFGQTSYGVGEAAGTSSLNFGDSGSYSRYFDLDKWAAAHLTEQQMKTFPFAIFPKASKSEKNKGLTGRDTVTVSDGRKKAIDNPFQRGKTERVNSHPTVKPLKLMSYLITLTTREGDTVLDPFVGSGTTVVAAEQLGRNGIGIEREAEYAEIARARVEHAKIEDDTNKRQAGQKT